MQVIDDMIKIRCELERLKEDDMAIIKDIATREKKKVEKAQYVVARIYIDRAIDQLNSLKCKV